jgi:hypothetical protein
LLNKGEVTKKGTMSLVEEIKENWFWSNS